MAYGQTFFDVIRPGCQASAAVVAPLVHELLAEHAHGGVIDVGCGEGWWGKAFEELGWTATGLDHPDTPCQLERFVRHDLRYPMPDGLGRYDLAVSLEVAEHLPAERADAFVAKLCDLAPVVLFSAAIPGQGGTGHVNEQWPDYWAERFRANGFGVSGALRFRIWNDERVENWYRQNLLLCVPVGHPLHEPPLFGGPTSPPFPMVHPVLYNARRSPGR